MSTEAFESIKKGVEEAIAPPAQGEPVDAIVHTPSQPIKDLAKIARRGDAARALFQKWIDEEVDQEHKQTFEYLAEALDQDRLSYRKHFPATKVLQDSDSSGLVTNPNDDTSIDGE